MNNAGSSVVTLTPKAVGSEGLEPQWSVARPGVSAIAALEDGSAHLGSPRASDH
jgi:hypothetical protein